MSADLEAKIFSVSEISNSLKNFVRNEFFSVRIQGEISGLKKHTSGHTYFSLKDSDAMINAICWRGTKIAFEMEDGMEILASGRIETYPARSQYQLIVENMMLAGEGALLKLLNERRKKFEAMGYFVKKRALPKFPKTIGIVTSKTGAVLQDMKHRLADRYPFCEVLVWSVNVQGAGAAEQIAAAIFGFNLRTEKKPDVLIVARGGGSTEDLFAFNEEVVVKAVFESEIVVISAIGHETDTTLIDYAADLRAPTPTAAIELATPVLSEIQAQIEKMKTTGQAAMSRLVKEFNLVLFGFAKSFQFAKTAIFNVVQRFDECVERFLAAMRGYVERIKNRMQMCKMADLRDFVLLKKQLFHAQSVAFEKAHVGCFYGFVEMLKILSNRLEQSSYKKILEKGFCFITTKSGLMIQTTSEFQKSSGNGLLVHFKDGDVEFF